MAKWLERQSFLDDLASLDKDLYKGLIALKNYPGDPEDLALNFTIAEDDFGATRSIDLVHDGSNISVNRANRNECGCRTPEQACMQTADHHDHSDIQLVCDYKLNRQISKQCFYFFSGLSEMIDPKCVPLPDGCLHDMSPSLTIRRAQGSACSISKSYRHCSAVPSHPSTWTTSIATR